MDELKKLTDEVKSLIPELLTKKELGAEVDKLSAKYQETISVCIQHWLWIRKILLILRTMI